jgi:hypothetical protein
MSRKLLLVPLLLLALQLGMHGVTAGRNPHDDEDMVPGNTNAIQLAGPTCCQAQQKVKHHDSL